MSASVEGKEGSEALDVVEPVVSKTVQSSSKLLSYSSSLLRPTTAGFTV
jgi:hypothetical protein